MERGVEREALAVEPVPGFQERDVEGASVEGDDAGEAPQVLGQPSQERGLLRIIAHEVLPHAEAVAVDEPEADEEGGGAGASGQARRLGVEEGGFPQVEADQRRLAAQHGDGAGIDDVEPAQGRVAVERLQAGVGLYQEELAALVLHPPAFEKLLERNSRRRHARALAMGPASARRGRRQSFQPLLEAQAVAGRTDECALQALEIIAVRRRRGVSAVHSAPQPPEAVVEGGAHRTRMASSRARATSLPRVPASPAGPTQDGQPSWHAQAAISDRLSASRRA